MGDQLDMDVSAVEWLCRHFKEIKPQEMRRVVGQYGLTGKSQVIPMRQLSDGQRRRVLFAYLGLKTPHMFLMDEPTNALDLETIDALADAINEYDGGVIFVTHVICFFYYVLLLYLLTFFWF
jgi:ATP-binding cassette, subfamily F, member 2